MQTTKATIAMPTLPSEMVTLPTLTPRISWPAPSTMASVSTLHAAGMPTASSRTRNRSNTSITQMLAAQGRVGRQAEAVAHPPAGRRVGRGGLLEKIADQAMRQHYDRDHERVLKIALCRWAASVA